MLRLPLEIVFDDRVGSVENGLGGPVVLIEDDRGDRWKLFLELQDVANVGPTPSVHPLVAVADHADVLVVGGQLQHDLVLRLVRVLVLVDQDVGEPMAVVIQHVGMLTEQTHDVEEQVVEVHRSGPHQTRLVFGVHLGMLAIEDVLSSRDGIRGSDQLVLPQRNDAVHRSGSESLRVERQISDDVPGQPARIGRVVDGEVSWIPERLPVAAQDAHTRRVKRGHPHRLDDRPDEPTDPFSHFGRSLVRERDGQDARRRHTGIDEVSDAMGEYPGLARASPRHDE